PLPQRCCWDLDRLALLLAPGTRERVDAAVVHLADRYARKEESHRHAGANRPPLRIRRANRDHPRRGGPRRVRRRMKRRLERGRKNDGQRNHAEHVSIVETFERLSRGCQRSRIPRERTRKVAVLLDPLQRDGHVLTPPRPEARSRSQTLSPPNLETSAPFTSVLGRARANAETGGCESELAGAGRCRLSAAPARGQRFASRARLTARFGVSPVRVRRVSRVEHAGRGAPSP